MTRPYALDHLVPALRDVAAQLPPPDYDDLAAARGMVAAMQQYLPAVDTTGVAYENQTIVGPGGALPIRVYRPVGSPAASWPARRPALVFLHWGGFVLGDLDTEHGRCIRLSRDADLIVVSVDYRPAPEHRYPAGLDDADAAYRWVVDQADALARHRRSSASCGVPGLPGP